MKKMMILGAGIYQVPLIQCARRMGFETIVVSIPGVYPGFEIADRVLMIDTRDKEQVLRVAMAEQIDGICTTGTDVAVSSIGYVCDKMHLAGIPQHAAELLCDKARMKEAFLKGGVRCAQGRRVYSYPEAAACAKELGYPVAVKRVDSSGSRGITMVYEEKDLERAFEHARERSNQQYVLVERMLKGCEIGVDGYIRDHRIAFLAPHTKFVYRAEYSTVPVGHAFPCSLSAAVLDDIREQMQRALDAVGADNCCFNADVFIDGEKSYVIEVGGRCGATCIPELISVYYDFDYYEAMLLEASGTRAHFPEQEKGVPCMAKLMTSPVEGTITGIDASGLEEMKKSGIDVMIDHPVGAHVFAMSDGTDRIGHVLMKTDHEKTLDAAMSQARRCVMINGRNLEELWRN